MPTDLLSALIVIAFYSPPDCKLSDLERFPSIWMTTECYHFATKHEEWLDKQEPLWDYQKEYYRQWKQEAMKLKDTWAFLYYAYGGWSVNPEHRINSLRRLRIAIGDENYAAGQMPIHVPIYRFIDVTRKP